MSENKGFLGADEIPTGNDVPQFQTPRPEESPSPSRIKEPSAVVDVNLGGVNDTTVTVTDPSPIVILFGARTSGKTMTLVRLTRFLETHGYQVKPDPLFRSSQDAGYKDMCEKFIKNSRTKYAAESTAITRFMLIKVLDKTGRPICQLLEAPGEHYFDPDEPKKPFNTYINYILSLPNRRTWMFIVEQDWKDQEIRDAYVTRLKNMPPKIKRDKIIFTCHKVDKNPELTLSNGMPNTPQIFKNLKSQYPGMFEHFKNTRPIIRLFKKWNFAFVPFSAGYFTIDDLDRQVYTAGEDMYPRMLWKTILKTVKG